MGISKDLLEEVITFCKRLKKQIFHGNVIDAEFRFKMEEAHGGSYQKRDPTFEKFRGIAPRSFLATNNFSCEASAVVDIKVTKLEVQKSGTWGQCYVSVS